VHVIDARRSLDIRKDCLDPPSTCEQLLVIADVCNEAALRSWTDFPAS